VDVVLNQEAKKNGKRFLQSRALENFRTGKPRKYTRTGIEKSEKQIEIM